GLPCGQVLVRLLVPAARVGTRVLAVTARPTGLAARPRTGRGSTCRAAARRRRAHPHPGRRRQRSRPVPGQRSRGDALPTTAAHVGAGATRCGREGPLREPGDGAVRSPARRRARGRARRRRTLAAADPTGAGGRADHRAHRPTGPTVTDVIARAEEIADRLLFPAALATDRAELLPVGNLDAL